MAQGDIRLILSEIHVDFLRNAPAVVVHAQLNRKMQGETLKRKVADDKGGQKDEDFTEETDLHPVRVMVEYPNRAAFFSAGTALRDALLEEFRKSDRVKDKSIG